MKGVAMRRAVVAIDRRTGREQAEMVSALAAAGCTDPDVLRAMGRVPRETFLADELREEAYLERSLPIGEGQHMASPALVARTLQLLALRPGDKFLEIGTGSGYAVAVASHLAEQVYTVESNANLARAAACFLRRAGYGNIRVRHGDGQDGWRSAAPFDAISITFPAPSLVQPLLEQLAEGGRLVMALGTSGVSDPLLLVTRTPTGFVEGAVGVDRPGLSAASPASLSGVRATRPWSRTCA